MFGPHSILDHDIAPREAGLGYEYRKDEMIVIISFFSFLANHFPEVKSLHDNPKIMDNLPIYSRQQQTSILFLIFIEQMQLQHSRHGGQMMSKYERTLKRQVTLQIKENAPSPVFKNLFELQGSKLWKDIEEIRPVILERAKKFLHYADKMVYFKANPGFMNVATFNTQGNSFGEQALINNKQRMATVQCRDISLFAVMSKEDYLASIGKIEKKKL